MLPPLACVLRYCEEWRLVLARDQPSPDFHPTVIAGRSPFGQIVRRENQWIEFVRSIDVLTGGVLVRHDHCARLFKGWVRVLDGERS